MSNGSVGDGRRSGPSISLTFLGAAGTVTGSKFLVEGGGSRVLVDCGLFQGRREWRRRNWKALPLDASTVDTVILTHAHLDHTGYLPRLVREGFTGPVVCTPHTARLAEIVLRDAAHLQEEDAEYARQGGFSKHDQPLPLFDTADVEVALRLFQPVGFDTERAIGDAGAVTLRPAGHILGSAFAEVRIGESRVTFSGDLGRQHHPLLRAPARPHPAETIVVESTYGDRHHPAGAAAELATAIRDTYDRGGVALLPAFAVDRTPMLLQVLAGLIHEAEIPDLPVYVDSPMALAALDVYREAISEGDPQIRPEVLDGRVASVPPKLRLMATREASTQINDPREPCIIVSASGMATGGRVLHHLRYQLPHPRNSVILTGYQVPGTRGRDLADGATELKIHGRYVPVRAQVVSIQGFSAHADEAELVGWLDKLPAPETTYVVHGEPSSSEALARQLRARLQWNAVVARDGERVRLG